jgi:SAM-dependent methyltransferase
MDMIGNSRAATPAADNATISFASAEWRRKLTERLGDLYRNHRPRAADEWYFSIHGRPAWIENRVRTFLWFVPFMPSAGRVLDWGCKHAAESCLLRWRYGDALELHACDFCEREWYADFFDRSQATFRRLTDEVELPYAAGSFDAAVGSGVLEHAPLDYESLKELRRVLKPGGVLAVTYLPHLYSYSEWLARHVRRTGFHKRLYSKRGAVELFRRAGFHPLKIERQTFALETVADRLGLGALGAALAPWIYRLTPLKLVCSTLSVVAVKEKVM